MSTDVTAQLGLITRAVLAREHQGRPARVVQASRTYDTTPEDLWEAITTAERIPRWFLPVTGELRLGGRYQLEGNAGGQVTRCEPPRVLALTWEYGAEVSWVEVELSPDPAGGTKLALEHVAYVDDERWAMFGPGAVGVGWELALWGLSQHVGSGEKLDPAQAKAWSESAEGKVFMRGSSEGWGQASIASGTPEDAARAAVARTTAFYTGEG